MIIKIDNLQKVYKNGKFEVAALRGINLGVQVGEFVSIMGQSGSGKSTMMNILGCLDSISGGKYFLDGEDVTTFGSKELSKIRNKKIGFVFQSFNLLPKLTSLANVELPLVYGGVSKSDRKAMAMEALKKVGLESRVHHKPNELSGGQRQRVAIARALVNNPSILLADEPTGNLDSRSGEEIMEIFQKLNEEGSTIVMVTHEPEIAAHTKRIVLFRDGEILSDEPVKNIVIANSSKNISLTKTNQIITSSEIENQATTESSLLYLENLNDGFIVGNRKKEQNKNLNNSDEDINNIDLSLRKRELEFENELVNKKLGRNETIDSSNKNSNLGGEK